MPAYPSSECWRCASRTSISATTSSATGSDACATVEDPAIRDKNEIVNHDLNRMLKLHDKFPAELPPGVVEKAAKLRAGQIVLHIPRVEMIEEVENPDPRPRLELSIPHWNRESTCHLEIEGGKSWIPVRVACSYIFAEFILNGVRKSSVQVVDRDQGQFPRSSDTSPQQETVWRIERQPPAGIRLDYGLCQCSEELIEVVEVAERPRSYVRRIQNMASDLVTCSNLEFLVGVAATVRKREHPGPSL